MIDLGPAGGGVSAKRGDAAKLSKIKLHLGGNYVPTPPFLVDYVRQEIVNDPNGWYRRARQYARGAREHH